MSAGGQAVHDPEGWEAASANAAAARANVAFQIMEQLGDSELTGSRGLFAERVRQIMVAERSGDRTLLRAAVMEATIAGATWAATLDAQSVAGAR